MQRPIHPVRFTNARAAMSSIILAAIASVPVGCTPDEVSVEVGSPAPEISLTGATRDGVLPEPLRLRDFRGRTVVLAFFFKARTPG